MTRMLRWLICVGVIAAAVPADAQSLGTFRWQVEPFGSVLVLNVTQEGSVYVLHGYEEQCDNPSLPVYGVAVPQATGTVMLGLTTIMPSGHGLHAEATVFLAGFGGSWRDNANQSGTLVFNPGGTCPGGPRINPIHPDQASDSAGAAPQGGARTSGARKQQ